MCVCVGGGGVKSQLLMAVVPKVVKPPAMSTTSYYGLAGGVTHVKYGDACAFEKGGKGVFYKRRNRGLGTTK